MTAGIRQKDRWLLCARYWVGYGEQGEVKFSGIPILPEMS